MCIRDRCSKAIDVVKAIRSPIFGITTIGSIFDRDEIPHHILLKLSKSISELKFARLWIAESRADIILEAYEDDRLGDIISSLGHVKLSVGIGLESYNDDVREKCIHKGCSTRTYIKAFNVLKSLGVYTTAYVLLKPPFLTESEAIEDTTSSTIWALENGADLVIIMPLRVYEGTMVGDLYKKGLYKPVWCWSIIEVINRLSKIGTKNFLIKGYFTVPLTNIHMRGCSECVSTVVNLVMLWNLTKDFTLIDDVLAQYSCNCIDKWREELDYED